MGMTPREFAFLLDRAAEKEVEDDKRMWRHTSEVLAILATSATHQVWAAEDFNPYKDDAPEKPTTVKDLLAFVADLNKSMGGIDLRGRKN